uniref:Uncharacterized protein n=1 Tax=Avena sativa TaxID=4498 RepID=A0ACD5TDG8_AVESA
MKRTCASANASSVTMVEMVPPHGPGGANHIQPPPPLPPGVYFSPTRDECLGFLNRWIAGDSEMADTKGYIFGANVYGESPEALRSRHPPASIRGRGEHAWWFLSETRFQSLTAGGGASKRADRRVETGGFWRLEQSKEKLERSKKRPKLEQSEEEEELEEADGAKNSFGFYVGLSRKDDKTPWLMQEFTSANDDGAGKLGVPALYRVYVTPRATSDQLRAVFGEHGVKKGPDGKKLPARAMVPQEYFDGIAELLPEGSVRGGVVQEHVPAPPSPVGLLGYYGQQEQYVDQYHHQQQGQYVEQQQQQQEQYVDQYQQQQQQGQYVDQFQQQQQGPFSTVAPSEPPLASAGFIGDFTADDYLSMPMEEFLGMIGEHPALTVKGEEPNWGSLGNIVGDDELANFDKED